MKNSFIILLFLFLRIGIGFGQPNCLVQKDSICIKACELANEAAGSQGSRYSQELFDRAIELCPSFAYAYYEKSVPYLKQGLLKEWKELIDKAVELEPTTYLLNRACNQVQFFRNYEYGLKDLNKLYELKGHFDIGFNNSGEYHAQMLRAICYQKLGNVIKATEIMEELIAQPNYSQSMYDYFHLGIAYFELGDLEKAKTAFDKQNQEIEFAGTYFFYSKILEQRNQRGEALKLLDEAKKLYNDGNVMSNNYYHYIDQIFYSDIEKARLQLMK